MTLALNASEAFAVLNRSVAMLIKGSVVVDLSFGDMKLSPGFDSESGVSPRRETFQAASSGGTFFRRIFIEPPTDMVPALLDWTPEGIAKAKSSAKACAGAYAKAVEDLPREDAHRAPPTEASVAEALERAIDQAASVLLIDAEAASKSPFARVFVAECARALESMGSIPSIQTCAWKSALRDWAFDLDPERSKGLLALAPIAFSPMSDIIESMETGPAHQIPGGVPRKEGPKPKAYQLCENGSFISRVHTQSDSGWEIAMAVAENKANLGMEHGFHRHFLITPDGQIHGMDNIKSWADSTLALREAIELGSAAKPGLRASKPSL